MAQTLLQVHDLRTQFETMDGTVRAVDGVSFNIEPGRTLGVVGESGCGKSVTALSVMRLIERPGEIVGGSVVFEGVDLLKLSEDEMRDIRGNAISMIFQEPMTSLNPVYTCGGQIAEAVRLHEDVGAREATERAVDMLRQVGIPDSDRRAKQYPHELSGGMRQRVMIAMALSTYPQLLIADEPTTALDVTIQAQILELMKKLREERQMAIMLITHDLAVIAEMADAVTVMYAGQVVENSDVYTVFERPHHPYTRGLLGSIPRIGDRRRRLVTIEGVVPNPLNLPQGCLFARRCSYRMTICGQTPPPLQEVGPGQVSRCWLTADMQPPAVGAEASADEARAEAARLAAAG
jgi:oligopeptide/dipeptide ABC transporter ATP-binding protein